MQYLSYYICDSKFHILGPPSTPNVSILDVGVQSVNVTWLLIEDRLLYFTLRVTNLRSSSIEEINITKTLNNFVYESVSLAHCDVYLIQVTATNAAGSSIPYNVTRMLPSLPDISNVSRSLEHIIQKNKSGLTVTISFMVCITLKLYCSSK